MPASSVVWETVCAHTVFHVGLKRVQPHCTKKIVRCRVDCVHANRHTDIRGHSDTDTLTHTRKERLRNQKKNIALLAALCYIHMYIHIVHTLYICILCMCVYIYEYVCVRERER